jgi:hypothetical protein
VAAVAESVPPALLVIAALALVLAFLVGAGAREPAR